ncbi:MAG: helix-turn-helix domain-containing protein [Actinomycetota bacterium]|nr:helix-turn-helix domain-containing protein [Actinomycetota bacterium]
MATSPSGEPSRASGSAPSKSTTSAEDMVRVTRDARIIDLRRDGHTYVQIGSLVGVSKSTVFDAIKRWMDANGPSADQVEELRQFQGAQLDAYQAQLAPHLMRKLRNEDGEVIYDGNGDDRKPLETPDVNVGRLWLNVLERRARLYGLDLERSAAFGAPISREMLAEVVGWAPQQQDVIDVDGEEEPDDQEALGRGSEA